MKTRIESQYHITAKLKGLVKLMAIGLVTVSLASCGNSKTGNVSEDSSANGEMITDTTAQSGSLSPAGPKPSWAPDIKPEMQVVMEKLAALGGKPAETLSAPEARKQPSPADAVMAVVQENNIPMPASKVDTTGKDIPVKGGSIHLRIYTPKGESGPLPVIVYYHGGGWVIANLDTYSASAQGLAEQVGAVVVSVAYRQAPEFKFPTAHNDSYAAYEWVLKNAASIKGDPKRVAVVGESAGGNLACAVSMMARDKKAMIPLHQVLIYPIASYDMNSESYQKNASAKPLNKVMMQWFFDKYLPNKAAGSNPMISLVNADLKSLPATTIITAQYDPLQSDGMLLADKLKAANVTVDSKNYDGVTHEFFGMAIVVPQAKDAQAYAADALKKALK